MNSAFQERSDASAAPARQLVLVPGLGCTEELFSGQIPSLSRPGSRTVIIADTRVDDSVAAMARRLLDRIDGPFAVAGLSMGGYVALEIARQAPAQVTGLALLDTTAAPDAEAARPFRLELMGLAREGRLDEVHAKLWPRLVAPERQGDTALDGRVRSMLATIGADAFIRQQTAIMDRPDARAVLEQVKVPTLIVVGEHDVITPVAVAEDMAARAPRARLAVIKASGHLSTMEAPEQVTPLMEEWLAE